MSAKAASSERIISYEICCLAALGGGERIASRVWRKYHRRRPSAPPIDVPTMNFKRLLSPRRNVYINMYSCIFIGAGAGARRAARGVATRAHPPKA